MQIFEFIQKFFVIFLPGIVGYYLYATLNIQKEQHYYYRFLNICMLSVAAYIMTDIVFSLLKLMFPCFICSPINIIYQIGAKSTEIPTPNVVVSIFFAIVLACILTKIGCSNAIFKLGNKLKITRRIDNQSVWEHIFNDSDVVVLRDRITRNTYYGKVLSYSDNCEYREIYFEHVHVFDEYSNFIYYANKLYISREHNEFTLEIQNYDCNEGEKK